jgi:ABC-type branched-subunit amino acid transport system ATPase component
MSLLEVDNVVSGYGDMTILNGVDLEVAPGEVVSIIGPNGAGKSTLLKTIVGLLDPKQGSVVFGGDDITHTSPEDLVSRGVCYVPQTDNVFPSLSVEENLKMGSIALDDGFGERVNELEEMFPILSSRAEQRCGGLSGGQQQMVALASALVVDPDLLILDEPSAGLAPKMVDKVFDRIERINEAGTAILIVEQNARRSLRESDRGIVLAMGENRFEGKSEDLLDSEEIEELYLGGAA